MNKNLSRFLAWVVTAQEFILEMYVECICHSQNVYYTHRVASVSKWNKWPQKAHRGVYILKSKCKQTLRKLVKHAIFSAAATFTFSVALTKCLQSKQEMLRSIKITFVSLLQP